MTKRNTTDLYLESYANGSSAEKPMDDRKKYYEMARNQEYGDLLDKEVMLENAKANANKYAYNQANAQGFGGTGYANNAMLGINNQYLNHFMNAQNQSRKNILGIDQAEREEDIAKQNDRFQSVTTMLTQANEVGQMDSLLADYGYGTVGEDGSFTWGEKPKDMSDDDWNQMRYYYGLQKNAIDNQKASTQNNNFVTYGTKEALDGATFINKDGNVDTLANRFPSETNILWHHATSGTFNNGDVVKVTNSYGETIYMEFTGNGFKTAKPEDYDKTEAEQFELVYKDGKGKFQKVE